MTVIFRSGDYICPPNFNEMFELIREFPGQFYKALLIGNDAIINTDRTTPVKNIVIAGLGGSGIGGNLLAELLRDELSIPVTVNKGYFLPAFVDEGTLLILSSYSGNTEEVLSCAKDAIARGLKPVCVCAGGKLEDFAKENNLSYILIPSGLPPRAALGFSCVQLFIVLHRFGLINDNYHAAFKRVAEFLAKEQEKIIEDSEFLAGRLLEKVIIVYAEDKYESVALRLKQQINENSKMYCWFNVIPEMNHNEIVGWRNPNKNLAVLIFRSEDEFHRNTQRIIYKKDVIVRLSDNVYEIDAKGADSWEKHFYLIHFGDWLSYHLAMLQGIDPVEVNVITKLKDFLDTSTNAQ